MAGKQAANEVRLAERRSKACDLRRSGMSYRSIAAECGVSVQTAWQDVHVVLDKLDAEATDALNTHRRIGLLRLDRLIELAWTQAEQGDLQAIEQARKLEADRRKMLGLDAPEQQIHSVTTASPEEAARLVREAFGERATPRRDEGGTDGDAA